MTPAAVERRHDLAGHRRQRHRSAHRPPGRLHGPQRPAGLSSVEIPRSRYGPLPKWWSPTHFVAVALPLAIDTRPECLQGIGGGNVAPDTFLVWARAEAAAANRDGTQIIVSADNIAEATGLSVRTVKRCRTAARRLGVYRTMLWGRPMTHLERVRQGRGRYVPGAWPRRLANESCFLLPVWLSVALAHQRRQRTRNLRTHPRGRCRSAGSSPAETRRVVDHGTPPSGWAPQTSIGTGDQKVSHHDGRVANEAAAPPAPTSRVRRRVGPLAGELTGRLSPVPWLRGTSGLRIEYLLRPFEAAGWTVTDIRRALQRLDPRRWDRRSGVTAPAGLLAWFLRRLDPVNDRPSLIDAQEAELRTEQRRRDRLAAAARRAAATGPTSEYLAVRHDLEHHRGESSRP